MPDGAPSRPSWRDWPVWNAFRARDFRWLWGGTFISFVGTQAQTVAQGYYVYQLTGSKAALGFIAFLGMVPVTVIGPIAGALVDRMDRRKSLMTYALLYSLFTLSMAIAAAMDRLTIAHIATVSFIMGLIGAFEMPTRQSLVRQVVPPEHLSSAIPAQAMTFNLARIIGPAIGGQIVAILGAMWCFFVNAGSYLAVLLSVLTMRVDTRPNLSARREPVMDLLKEGVQYTLRNPSLRTLFLMECATSLFAIFYVFQMPALASLLKLGPSGLGNLMSSVGVGAMIALITLGALSQRRYKAQAAGLAMLGLAIGLLLLSQVQSAWMAYPVVALTGASAIMQFNTTNTLFQTIAPPRLHGRVLSMHIWAISGISPFGTLAMGAFAERFGLRESFALGGGLLLVAAIVAWMFRKTIVEPEHVATDEDGDGA